MFATNKKPVDAKKLRGGYYTPIELAQFLVKWAVRPGHQRILEPSAGDGNFVVAFLKEHQNGSEQEIVAIEIDKEEIKKGQERVKLVPNGHVKVSWISGDFLSLYGKLKSGKKFDAIFGNPPFIRFQYFDEQSREIAFMYLRSAGYNPNKLANAWAAFVELSIELINDGGRLAMVLPAELLQVKYAAELRARLSKQFKHIVIIGFRKLVFPEIQQEVVLLLAEGKREAGDINSDIHTLEYEDGQDLLAHGNVDNAIAHEHTKHSRNGMKWTSLFLSEPSFEALDEAQKIKGLIPLGHLANVDIGIVTGRNSFFVLTSDLRKSLGVPKYTVPLIGRTSALTSTHLKKTDFAKFAENSPAHLLYLTGVSEDNFSEALADYLESGQKEEIHLGFKCRIRQRWFDVPSVYVPDAFMFRQIHRYPLLVVNQAKVTSTDTIHRVRFKTELNPSLLATCFFNSLTLAWAEVAGRSYGGGVLELEPREAEELPIPYRDDIDLDIEKVDTLLRKDCEVEALDYVDRIVLHDNLGLDMKAIRHIRNAWDELRNRRIQRR